LPILTDIPGRDLDLVPAETLMDAAPEELRGVIRVGRPEVFDAISEAATSGTATDAQVQSLADDNRFTLVRLPLSIRPTERVTVRFLAVECALQCAEGGESLCWSMSPERVEQEITAGRNSALNATLKLGLVELGAERASEAELVSYQPEIIAFGVGLPDPAWELTPTRGRELRGVQMLHLVARTSRGALAEGAVRLRADVVVKRTLWNTKAVAQDGSRDVERFALLS